MTFQQYIYILIVILLLLFPLPTGTSDLILLALLRRLVQLAHACKLLSLAYLAGLALPKNLFRNFSSKLRP